MKNIYLALIYLLFLVFGATAPFIFSLGYVWVDASTPQRIASAILTDIPVSLIMAVGAIGSYLVVDRKYPPSANAVLILTLVFAAWITLSTFLWPVVPGPAAEKWDYAFKTVMFSAFIQYVFRSRLQIEAFLQIYLFSLIVQFLPGGIKAMVSGGGYGMELGMTGGNVGLSEGSTLAAVSLMLVPLILYLRAHTLILPKSRLTDLLYLGLVIGAISASMSTYERTALVGMFVLGLGLWFRARRKLLGAIIGIAAATVIFLTSSSGWNARIATTKDFQTETSALARILVWQWTLGYVLENPLGGGFNSYMIDRVEFPGTPDHPETTPHFGIAFHNIYFEVLGEQGWPGLGMFLSLIGLSLMALQSVLRRTRRIPHLLWCHDLAAALQNALLILAICGNFIGIAFQPMLWYLFAITACLRQHVVRIEAFQKPATRFSPVYLREPDRTAA